MNNETFSPKLTVDITFFIEGKGVPINMVKVMDCFLGLDATSKCEEELNNLRDFLREKIHYGESEAEDISVPLVVDDMYTEITQEGSTVEIVLRIVGKKDEVIRFVQELKDKFGFHILINPAW